MYANPFTLLFAGYTPLQVAFELYREDWAKLLIEAGADQTCRDKSGRNILHSLLQRRIDKDEEVDELKRMLDIIDKRVLQTLFVERSTGSLTPLQHWLSGAHQRDKQVLKLILEYGGGQELNFISGEGDTPLHHTVKNHNSGLTRIILEHDATLLNRENATGRTPYEMAEDMAIANVCNSPPPMPSDSFHFNQRHARRLGLKFEWSNDLVNQSPKSFVEEPNDALPSPGSGVWSLLQETKARLDAEGRSARRLVTLNEANEVAKRLAAMKASARVHREKTYDEPEVSDEDDETQGADEVGTYMSRAKQSL
jgi:ankyrin repeat protein